MSGEVYQDFDTQVAKAPVASGTSVVKSDPIDLFRYSGALIFAGVITPAVDTNAKLQVSDTTTDGDFVDVASSTQGNEATAGNGQFMWSVHKCRKRYVRVVYTRATATVTQAVIALKYGGKDKKATNKAISLLLGFLGFRDFPKAAGEEQAVLAGS